MGEGSFGILQEVGKVLKWENRMRVLVLVESNKCNFFRFYLGYGVL